MKKLGEGAKVAVRSIRQDARKEIAAQDRGLERAVQADDVPRAFRLSRKGDVYDVAQTVHGPTCDCPDFIFRRDGLDPLGCLHIRAMRAVGML